MKDVAHTLGLDVAYGILANHRLRPHLHLFGRYHNVVELEAQLVERYVHGAVGINGEGACDRLVAHERNLVGIGAFGHIAEHEASARHGAGNEVVVEAHGSKLYGLSVAVVHRSRHFVCLCLRVSRRGENYNELISYKLGFHAEYTTKREILEGISDLAKKYKAPVFTHSSETKSEVEGCIERYGKTPTVLFEELGLWNFGGGGFHSVWLSDEDMQIYKKRGLWAVLNAGSNSKLASGIADVQKMSDMGINLAVGTDGPSSNNALDMFREMYLISVLQKLKHSDAAAMNADEILKAATVGSAKCMGLNNCDCIEKGKCADLIVIDLDRPNMQPINNITKNLVYSGSKENVKLTMINGKILYENGEFLTVDKTEIYQKAQEVTDRIKR